MGFMSMLRHCLVFANDKRAFRFVEPALAALDGLTVDYRSDFPSRDELKQLPADSYVIHLQTPYEWAPKDCDVSKYYRRDAALRRLKDRHDHYLALDLRHLEQLLPKLPRFFDIQMSPTEIDRYVNSVELPISDFEQQLDPQRRLYEDRRLLLYHEDVISPKARRAIDLKTFAPAPEPEIDNDLSLENSVIVAVVDKRITADRLRAYFEPPRPGVTARVLIVIYSHLGIIREYLSDPFFAPALEQGVLKLWHVSEWEERLQEELGRMRSAVVGCGTAFGDEGNPISSKLLAVLHRRREIFPAYVNQCARDLVDYYKSDQVTERRAAIVAGAKPRILIEQACSSVAVKQYSRNIEAAFKALGYETYIHPNCKADERDFVSATVVDANAFRPDLLIASPNNIRRGIFMPETIELPVLFPIQDLEPHMGCAQLLGKHPLPRFDMISIMQQRFASEILQTGVRPDQLSFDLLPTEKPTVPLEREEVYDLGFVKTMGRHERLEQAILSSGRVMAPSKDQRATMAAAEEWILSHIRDNVPMDLYQTYLLAQDYDWNSELLIFAHEAICRHYMLAACNAGFSLGLSGANWDRIPQLRASALEHIHCREEYQRRFLRNRINLSMNPWNEYHARVLDGGRLGAFFLVYRVDSSVRWQGLPEDFEAGVHLDYFSSPEELKQKARYYLERPELRHEIGDNLRLKVEAEYSYEQAAENIVERFRKVLRGQLQLT